jgi:hypothetical protein
LFNLKLKNLKNCSISFFGIPSKFLSFYPKKKNFLSAISKLNKINDEKLPEKKLKIIGEVRELILIEMKENYFEFKKKEFFETKKNVDFEEEKKIIESWKAGLDVKLLFFLNFNFKK